MYGLRQGTVEEDYAEPFFFYALVVILKKWT